MGKDSGSIDPDGIVFFVSGIVSRIAYKFRLEPTVEQQQSFVVFSGQVRFVYNALLRQSKDAFAAGTKYGLSAKALCYPVTDLKKEFEWLKECHIHCLQESARALSLAYARFFSWCKKRSGRRVGMPRFKSKRSPRSFSYKAGIKVDGNKIWLPKIGWVKFRKSRELIGTLKTATVRQSASGKWYVSVSAERPIARKPKRQTAIGIDVGLETYATVSTGEKVAFPRWLKRSLKKLRRLQKSLSRKQKGSKNRAKARLKVAHLHERVANQRHDFQHKLSTKLVDENQAIGVETLSIKGLCRGRAAKSWSDAGHGEFLRQLEYKSEWYGRQFEKADRFFPSSKTCSCCGQINKDLKLSDRTWQCDGCGVIHDRDVNAAINLKPVAEGCPDTQNVSGVAVSLPTGSTLR